MTPKDRITSRTRPKFEPDGTLYFEKFTKVVQYDGLEWHENPELRKVEKLTPESQGYVREISSSLIITRKAYGSDMKEITGYFQQKILIRINLTDYGHDYDYAWLYRTSRGHIMVTNFENQFGCGQGVAFNDSRFVNAIGKAKRISELEAKKLLISHEALALVDEVKNPETKKEEYRINV
jgi:hypothetical protein